MNQAVVDIDVFLMPKTRIAQFLGIDRHRVSTALEILEPHSHRRGVPVWHLRDAIRAIYEKSALTDPEQMSPKDRRDWYESERVRLNVELEKKQLVTVDAYRTELARVFKEIANTIETLPDVLERKYAIPPEVLEHLQSGLDEIRETIAAGLSNG